MKMHLFCRLHHRVLISSFNRSWLLKRAGIHVPHSQHSRGEHSAFFSSLSVKELTEGVNRRPKDNDRDDFFFSDTLTTNT